MSVSHESFVEPAPERGLPSEADVEAVMAALQLQRERYAHLNDEQFTRLQS
jgi:hypothetical protein